MGSVPPIFLSGEANVTELVGIKEVAGDRHWVGVELATPA